MNRLVDEESRIVERRVFESRRKCLAHLRHRTADFICNLKGIGTGKSEDGNVRGFFAAETREDRVLLLAQLYPGDVLDAHHYGGLIGLGGLERLAGFGGGGFGLDDDILELFYIGHPAQGVDGELEHLVGGRRRSADLSRRHLNVLVLDCVLDVQNRQSIGLELVRVQPDPHAVRSGAEDRYLTDSRQTRNGALQIDDGVIAQKRFIEAIVVRVEAFDQQDIGADLLDVDSLRADLLRQLRQRAIDGVLH